MGVYYGMPTIGDFEALSANECGSVKDYLQEYMK
jgi:hypothetical protein